GPQAAGGPAAGWGAGRARQGEGGVRGSVGARPHRAAGRGSGPACGGAPRPAGGVCGGGCGCGVAGGPGAEAARVTGREQVAAVIGRAAAESRTGEATPARVLRLVRRRDEAGPPVPDEAWASRGACRARDVDPGWFDADRSTGGGEAGSAALEGCRGWPVRLGCMIWAVEGGDWWGGAAAGEGGADGGGEGVGVGAGRRGVRGVRRGGRGGRL